MSLSLLLIDNCHWNEPTYRWVWYAHATI